MSDQQNSQGETARVQVAWGRFETWLTEHAPTSAATLLPPAREDEMAAAEEDLGFGIPMELKALWRLCGGVSCAPEPSNSPEHDPRMFLPSGILLSLAQAAETEAGFHLVGEPDPWGGNPVLPWVGEDHEGSQTGLYLLAGDRRGVGEWSAASGPELDEPGFDALASYLEAVAQVLGHGTGPMADWVPGISRGCLAWREPLGQTDGLADWHPLWL